MDDVKLLSTKIFGECNLIGNVKYDKNEILENWISVRFLISKS